MVARPERDPLPRKPSYPLLPPCAFGADTADGGVVLTPLTPICAAERGINTCTQQHYEDHNELHNEGITS